MAFYENTTRQVQNEQAFSSLGGNLLSSTDHVFDPLAHLYRTRGVALFFRFLLLLLVFFSRKRRLISIEEKERNVEKIIQLTTRLLSIYSIAKHKLLSSWQFATSFPFACKEKKTIFFQENSIKHCDGFLIGFRKTKPNLRQ